MVLYVVVSSTRGTPDAPLCEIAKVTGPFENADYAQRWMDEQATGHVHQIFPLQTWRTVELVGSGKLTKG